MRWTGMLLQLFISAALTGIGSMAFQDGLPITVMAATNTIIAGILALLHNSGLPDRYRYNQIQFEEVEDYLKVLLRARVIEEYMGVHQVLMECFQAYADAKSTTSRNGPSFFLRSRMRHRQAGQYQLGEGEFDSTYPPATAAPPQAQQPFSGSSSSEPVRPPTPGN